MRADPDPLTPSRRPRFSQAVRIAPALGFVMLSLMTAGGCVDSGCSESGSGAAAEGTAGPAAATASAGDSEADGFVLPPKRPFDPNPLNLSASAAIPPKGALVYAIPKAVLAQLKEGSTVVLRKSVVEGRDGDAVVVRRSWHDPYPIHPGYLLTPNRDKLRRGDFVLAAYQGRLHHAVVVTLLHRTAIIRYTDLGRKLSDQRVKPEALSRIAPGFHPGALAVYQQGSDWRHAMLISKTGSSWFTIGYGGEAKLVPEDELVAVPRELRPKPKTGTKLWVVWRGEMVDATVRKIESPELFVLKRPRAGTTILAGIGQVMHPH